MSANNRDRNVTPESTYHYVQGLLKVEDNDDESNIMEDAVGVCFNYLTQKKMEWGIFLEKLMVHVLSFRNSSLTSPSKLTSTPKLKRS